jgi:hypothetical protein
MQHNEKCFELLLSIGAAAVRAAVARTNAVVNFILTLMSWTLRAEVIFVRRMFSKTGYFDVLGLLAVVEVVYAVVLTYHLKSRHAVALV